jgi:hypothetical protein
MIWIGLVAALAALWLLGALALDAARMRSASAPGMVVADLVAGALVVSALGTAMIAVGARLSVVPFYVVLAGLLLVAARRGSIPCVPRLAVPRDGSAIALLAAASATTLAIAVAAVRDRLWWDGWAIWSLKSRVLFLDGTLAHEFLQPGGGYAFAHPEYPLALPILGWWIYSHAGSAAPALSSFMGAVWLALAPLLLWSALREESGERVSALAALGLVSFWPIAFYATGGTADVLVALCLLGAAMELERGFRCGDDGALGRCAAFLALGALTKNEGLAIAVVAGAVALFMVMRSHGRRPGRLLPFALPFIVLAPWWLLTSSLGVREPTVAAAAAAVFTERIPVLAAGMADILLSGPWLPLPFLAAIGVAAAVARRADTLIASWFLVLGYLAAVCTVYLLTPHELVWLMNTSLTRVLSVFVPVVVFLSVRSACWHSPQSTGGRPPTGAAADAGSTARGAATLAGRS